MKKPEKINSNSRSCGSLSIFSLLLFAAVLFSATTLRAQSPYLQNAPPVTNPQAKPGYTLIFSDEFNQKNIDDNNSHRFGLPWWCENPVGEVIGLGKFCNTSRDPQNLQVVSDGMPQPNHFLEIKMVKETISPYHLNSVWVNGNMYYGPPDPNHPGQYLGYDFPVTSASISSLWDFKYGYFEVRSKLPKGSHINAAFTLWGETPASGACNKTFTEIDIYETMGNNSGTDQFGSNIHYADPSNPNCDYNHQTYAKNTPGHAVMDPVVLSNIGDLTETYNTYAVEWSPTEIKFYFNNVLYLTEPLSEFGEQHLNDRVQIKLGGGVIYSQDKWAYILAMLTSSAIHSFDYVRVYKKNPVITADPSNCMGPGRALNFTASTGISGDTYQWSVSPGATLYNANSATVIVVFDNGVDAVDLTVKATGTKFYEKCSTTIRIPDLPSDFRVTHTACTNNNITLTVECDNSYGGSMFVIYPYDPTTNTISAVQQIQWGCSATFDNGLVADAYYMIKHGVWVQNCINWSETIKYVQLKLSEFNLDLPVNGSVNNNGINQCDIKISAHALTNIANSEWRLYHLNGGIMGNQVGNTQWGNDVTFAGLTPNTYYRLRHGVWGSCGAGWTQTDKDFLAPSFTPKADFAIHYDNLTNDKVKYSLSPYPTPSAYNRWWIHISNANGEIFTEVDYSTDMQPEFTVDEHEYYLITHEIYTFCSAPSYKRYLVRDEVKEWFKTACDTCKGQLNIREIDYTPTQEEIDKMKAMFEKDQNGNAGNVIVGNRFKVFPNPSQGNLNLEYDLKNEYKNVSARITDAIGRTISQQMISDRSGTLLFENEKLSPGIYYLTIHAENAQLHAERVIIIK